MVTYTKKLKTLDVYLLYDGEKVTIADTADDDKATRALNEFKKYGTMHYETTEGGEKVTNEIPYHAVQYIEVTEEDASVEKPDPYGCEGDEPTSNKFVLEMVTIPGEEPVLGCIDCCDKFAEVLEATRSGVASPVANGYVIIVNDTRVDISNAVLTENQGRLVHIEEPQFTVVDVSEEIGSCAIVFAGGFNAVGGHIEITW